MRVNLPPELQVKVDRIAAQHAREPESLAREAVERLVGYDDWFIRPVEIGLSQLERGEALQQEEVPAKFENPIPEKQGRT
jgi:predicted transcriptional regulator